MTTQPIGPIELSQPKTPAWVYGLVALAIMALAAAAEHAMGRVWICTCGHVRLWVGDVNSSENSQQIADWYSFSHIIHGFILYALAWWISRRRGWPLGWCFVLAVGLEVSWEVLENSPIIIDRYRQTTISLGYTGDSVLNSMSDILFAILGFALAARLPVWLTITLIVLMELGVGYAIRDNLTLNIIMLIHPSRAIKRWQMGA